MDSPEYEKIRHFYPQLITCVKQSPNDIADHLVPIGILAPRDLDLLSNPQISNDDKARRIVSVVMNRVKNDPQELYKFVSALEAAGTWTKKMISRLIPESELKQANNTSSQGTVPILAQSSMTPSVQSKCTSSSVSASVHSQESLISPSSQSTMTPNMQPQSTNTVYHNRRVIQEPSVSDLYEDESQSSYSLSVARSTSETSSPSGANSPATDSQQSSYLRFECGCEQCSVYDYISGKVCPNPKVLPFPKFEIFQLPPEEIELIEEGLRDRTRSIHFKFCSLISNTFKELSKKVKYPELLSFLKLCLTSPCSRSATESLDELDNVDNTNLPKYLMDRCYCSWFDYSLIKHLREHFLHPNQTDDDKALSDYKECLRCYVSQRCFIYFHNTGPLPKDCIEVICKVDLQYSELSEDKIKKLKLAFTNIIEASKYHLVFMSAKEGCTELTFGAPPYFSEITCLSELQISQLKDLGILKVTINGRKLLQGEGSDSLSSVEGSDSGSVHEADIDTTELTSTEIGVEVSFNKTLHNFCKGKLEIIEEMQQLNVSPWSWKKVSHDRQPFMALVYNGKVDDKVRFSEFIKDMLIEKQYVLSACCVHLDHTLSYNPILLFKPEQSLKDYCLSSSVISEVDQLTILRDIALGTLGFLSNTRLRLKVTVESIFVHTKDIKGGIRALFSPLHHYSYFPHTEQTPQPSADFEWVKNSLLLMQCQNQCAEQYTLPESHILHNIFTYKWFSDEKSLHPTDNAEIAKEIAYILDLEETRLKLIDDLSSSNVLEVSHLHMILIGHTGVGKTSIRKHLQSIPFNSQEKSTVIMEQELLCQDTIETTSDSSSLSFQKSKNIYKCEPDKVFLTLWDTGGQPMFQDLLPCFAKLRSIYGIVFRLCDLLENRTAIIRPVSSLECEQESPYSYVDYIYRCLAFLDSFQSSLHNNFLNIPPEVKNVSFESSEIHTFPRLALIGTFKDTVREGDLQLKESCSQLRESLDSAFDFQVRTLFPEHTGSVLFEVDNTRSGQIYEDPGIVDLRKQIVACTQKTKAKIPSAWIPFKVDLEHEAKIQRPCTGIVTFEKAVEIAKKYKIDPKPALCYFDELGIFLWYHEKQTIKDYIIIEPRNLVSILGTIFDPGQFRKFPDKLKQLQMKGIIDTEIANQLLDCSRTGLPLEWVFSFFEEHHLAVSLKEGYFIPSMLRVVPICHNHLHLCDMNNLVCTPLSRNDGTEVAPLFLVSRSKCIPPGFFPRFLTMLAMIQDGRIAWKLCSNSNNCRNMVSFMVNDQAIISFTEFLHCIRVQLEFFPSSTISGEFCCDILSQLKVQLQRVFPQVNLLPVSVTFACFCSKTPHFLRSLPSTTKDTIHCNEHPDVTFEPTKHHEVWLKSPPEISSERDAKKVFETALAAGLVNLQVSTVLFVGNEDSSYTEMLFGEPGEVTNFVSNFYLVEGQEMQILKSEYVDYFLACNAMVPQEASSQQENFHGQSSAKDKETRNEKMSKEDTSGVLSHEPTSEEISSESQKNSQSPQEISSDQSILNGESSTHDSDNSQVESSFVGYRKNVFTETSGNVLKLMSEASEEKHCLQLIHAIECNNLKLIPILPLILQCANTFGVGYTKSIKTLKSVQHLSNNWLIVKTEETSIELSKAFSSHKTPFESNVSIQPKISVKDLALHSHKAEEKAIPYAWYFLCHSIQNAFKEIKRKVMSMDEVSDIAAKYHISEDVLPEVLIYLHKAGFLLYYRDILPDVIFEDASLIIKILSSLTAVLNPHNKVAMGIFGESSLSHVDDVFVDDLFPLEVGIELLLDLSIIISLNNIQSFCMPTLLKEVFDEKHLRLIKQGSVPPLHVIYPVAPGVFEFLLCYLTSEQNEELWPWRICIDLSKRQPTCLYKNCAELALPGYDCIITLLQSSHCIKVYVDFAGNEPPFAKIAKSIFAGVKKANSSYYYPDTDIKLGFSCTCGSVDVEHSMIFQKQDYLLVCTDDLSRETFPLSYNHKLWLEEGIQGDKDALSIPSVFQLFRPRYKEWYQVGLELGLTTEVLENISGRYRAEPDVALMMIIRDWFSSTLNPTWDLLTKVHAQTDVREQQDVDTDYYDIVVIGRTGMGKSSTVDKLMVPLKDVCILKRAESDSNISEDSGSYSLDDSQLDRLYIRSKCPCGKSGFGHCTVNAPSECIDGRHSRTQNFAEIDLENGKDAGKARSIMRRYLASDTEKTENKFVTYASAVYRWAKSLPTMKIYLKRILRSRFRRIESEDFKWLYDAATDGADFINYEIISDLIMGSCKDASLNNPPSYLKEEAEKAEAVFKEVFKEFAQHRIFSKAGGLEIDLPNSEQNQKELMIKVEENSEVYTYKHLHVLKSNIRTILNLSKEVVLRVTSVREGCVEVTFYVQGPIADSVASLSDSQKRDLLREKVTLLMYDGEVKYCCCGLLDNEVCKKAVVELYSRARQQDCQHSEGLKRTECDSTCPYNTTCEMREHSSGAEELITDSEDCEEDFFTEHNMVSCNFIKDNMVYHKTSLENYQYSTGRKEHAHDCLYIKNQATDCPEINCVYCGQTFCSCIYEYHSISCEMRGQSSDDTLSSDSGGSDCDEAFSNESRVRKTKPCFIMASNVDTPIESATSNIPDSQEKVDPESVLDEIDKIDWSKLSPQLQSIGKEKHVYENAKSFSILVIGKTGSGKSTLANGILGLNVKRVEQAKKGQDLDPCTTTVETYHANKGKISATVWDSPGLQDGTKNEKEYLKQVEEMCSKRDLTTYCIKISDTRLVRGSDEVRAMDQLTTTCGPKFWKSTIIVLTFANSTDAIDEDWDFLREREKPQVFERKIKQWQEKIQAILINEIKVSEEIVRAIRIVPAGYYRKPHLPSYKFWLSNLWLLCVGTISTPEVKAVLIKMNARRFKLVKDVTEQDFSNRLRNNQLLFPPTG